MLILDNYRAEHHRRVLPEQRTTWELDMSSAQLNGETALNGWRRACKSLQALDHLEEEFLLLHGDILYSI